MAFLRQSLLLTDPRGILYIANGDGTGAQPVTDREVHLSVRGRDPWSRDGSRLAFSYFTDTPQGGAYLVNSDGSNPRQPSFTHPTDSRFSSWSVDGDWILFNSGDDVFRIRPDGSGARNLTNNAFIDMDAVWSSLR